MRSVLFSFRSCGMLVGFFMIISLITVWADDQSEEPKLVAHWSFDASDGDTTFYDVTGNGYDATCSKKLATEQGIKGKAIVSNVTGYSFHISNSVNSFSMPEFSVEALVNLNLVPGQNYIVLSNQSYPGEADGGYALEINEYGQIRFSMVAPESFGWVLCEGVSTLHKSQWYHLAATYDGKLMKVFVNGVLEGSVSRPGGYIASKINASIGCQEDINGTSRCWINGKIDELKLFNFALPEDSIAAHFASYEIPEPPAPEPKLIAHWSFDSTNGVEYYDITGNGFTAVANKSSLAEGVWGKALDCSDNSFEAVVPNSVGKFDFDAYTIEGWIYSYIDLMNPGSFYNYKSIFNYQRCGMEGSGVTGGYNLQITDRGELFASMSYPEGGEWFKCPSKEILLPRKWYHVASTYDGSTIKVYINGTLAQEVSVKANYLQHTIPAYIGCQFQVTDPSTNAGRIRQRFNGKIDELKLYNYALDAKSLKSHYEALKPADEPQFEINLGMKTTHARPGDTVVMPVFIANHEEYLISAVQLVLKYDPAQLTLISISKDSGLVKDWELFDWNGKTAGNIPIAMAGMETKLSYGEGELFRCVFEVSGALYDDDTCLITLNDINIDEKNNLVVTTVQHGRIIISQYSFLYGDVTGNGEVNVVDAQYVLKYVVGALQLPDEICCPNFTLAVADVSGNGAITSYDAALIFQYSIGLIDSFPVETNPAQKLAKRTASGAKKKADIFFKLVNNSESELVYDLVGANLRGFYAGEFSIEYKAASDLISRSTITTAVRGATLMSRINSRDKQLKVAVTSNDDIDDDNQVTIIRIVLPPSPEAVPEFTIKTALINEGKIATAYDGGLVGVISNAVEQVLKRPSVRVVNNMLAVHSAGTGSGKALLTIYNLSGRIISRYFITDRYTEVDISKFAKGAYLFRLQDGAIMTGGRFMAVNR